MLKAVFYLISLSLLSTFIFAQNSSNISGIVKDQNGAAIVGATVSLQDKTTITNVEGEFELTNLTDGKYQIKVSAKGFEQKIVSVHTTSTENLEIILDVNSSEFTVTAEIGQNVERQQIPQPVSIISADEISERATSVLAQAGTEEAGINMQRTSPTLGAIVVRGLTGKNVVMYVDGVRYTNSGQRGGINTFFNLNEPTSIGSIEILRGASSAQYGSDALGGTVNLITKNNFATSDKPEFNGEFNPVFNSSDRSFGVSAILSYGTNRLNAFSSFSARRVNTLRTAKGIDSHSAITRFLGLPSDVLYDRNPDTKFTQYAGAFRFNYVPRDEQQIIFQYQRSQQDDGKRFDDLLGGNGNLISNLANLMLDFGYLRYVKQNLGIFDSGSFTVSYNSQREERQTQGGQGNPLASIVNQYERTNVTGFSFFLDKNLPKRNNFTFGGDFYAERLNSPAHTDNPVTGVSVVSRPRVPDEAKFDSGGLFIQNAWEAIPNRLRITGALRYSAMSYRVREADSPIVNGRTLWRNDSLRTGSFSGRIGGVVSVTDNFRLFVNFSRGFRYPSMTDLGTLGITGDGYEVDFLAATNLDGTIGTTADENAVTTGIPVEKQRSEISNNYDFGFRFQRKRFDTELSVFLLDLKDTITKQTLILPQGAVGQFLGDQQIIAQNANGAVFVSVATNPVLVRANYTSARLFGLEYETEFQITDEFMFKGNYTYIRAEDKETGEPPNIEGGTPPPTAFLSLRYNPSGKPFWLEFYSTLAQKQNRLSTLDLGDRRTGGTRSRSQIANFFRRGACVRGLTNNPDGVCGSGDETILLATGETLAEVQNRVLGNANSAPLFTELPSYVLVNLRGGFTLNEKSKIYWSLENIFDQQYRNPSWGIDGAGRSFRVGYRFRF